LRFNDKPGKENLRVTGENAAMNTIKNYILEEFLVGEDASKLTPTTPLMSTGILDSIATMKLIMFLEEEFGIQVSAHEIDEEHLNTLEAICGLIRSKS